ncbi:MAG: hypothetical protein AAF944_26060 [Bacteroidota bacterium]
MKISQWCRYFLLTVCVLFFSNSCICSYEVSTASTSTPQNGSEYESKTYQPINIVEGDTLRNINGIVTKLSDIEYDLGIKYKDHPSVLFVTSIPKEFKREGLEVSLTGVVLPIPPNIRLPGIPIKLLDIKFL